MLLGWGTFRLAAWRRSGYSGRILLLLSDLNRQGFNATSMWASNWRRAVDVAGVVICIVVVVFVIRFLRREWLEHKQHEHRVDLYQQATTFSTQWTGSDGEIRAVRELGSDPSEEAERALIDLASNAGPLTVGAQREAVRELAKRNDPKIPPLLAGLIQPGTLLESRMAAAEALQSMPCNAQCTRSLLSYLNRIDRGELNAEQQGLGDLGADLHKTVEAMNKPIEQRIYGLVYAVLLRSPDTTSTLLTQDYGLGTAKPSQFAIAFVTRAKREAFCSALIQSERQIELAAPVRVSVSEAIESLKCAK
jgi:hypothetical protein